MSPSLDRVLIQYSTDKLSQLVGRIEDCLGRLAPEQIWARGGENENAVGNLVLHLCGNVRQWIIAGIGGVPDVRVRDAEFAARAGESREELAARLRGTVDDAIAVLRLLAPERLLERVRIQAYDVTVLEAVLHVVEHFSHHTGQIIFITKAATGSDLGYYRHLSRPAHGEKTP